VAGWTSTSASLHRGQPSQAQPEQTVIRAEASVRTTEYAQLVAQSKIESLGLEDEDAHHHRLLDRSEETIIGAMYRSDKPLFVRVGHCTDWTH
jgi:hypothetical protein